MAGVELDRQGTARVGGVELRAPGLAGTVEVTTGGGTTVRGRALDRGQVGDALRRNEMTTTTTIVVDRPRRARGAGAGTTRGPGRGAGRAGGPTIELEVPAPKPGDEQVVLSTDEHGIRTWHFHEESASRAATRSGRRMRTYRIDTRDPDLPAPTASDGTRGFVPGLAKIIEVITFPAAHLVGGVASAVLCAKDREAHPPRLRIMDREHPGTFRDLVEADWSALAEGPALLLVHGTFSTTEGAFGALPEATWRGLADGYDHRVLAYDHPTVADDPIQNASSFFTLTAGRTLELDLVCHSRGGLVSRSIAERPEGIGDAAPEVSVRRVIFVGATNVGTILADVDHWNALVDRMTTMLSLVPLPAGADILESLFGLVKAIAVNVVDGLHGLTAMAPSGAFLERINGSITPPGTSHYLAIVSNYEPTTPGLRAWLNDGVRDVVFGLAPNDMMVANASTCGDELTSRFPIPAESRFLFGPKRGVEHADFFGQPETSDTLLEWLVPAPKLAGSGAR